MSGHNRGYRGGSIYSGECTCGWRAYGARDAYQADEDLTRHLDEEWEKVKAAAAAEAERVRLLTEGQNWDQA
ncbi:hypothetical protein CQ010_01435 [Arthrobacter sp. MYb211]|nr:hypothetical protein CQ015_03690 [Arthrobacter sp. MYb221]PRC10534.1 hypothetical protein CQ010_01435 [Arthrobacter sp. MYb211]